ncbi:Uu.00g068680.m01.CDS01 [Anthostomella pinea]|uniref:Uu.00g068680.m01.CDS01 n=1 Tax=Anthostomella pinea TaxID=933095 RepID=A0AAI8VUD5_9PEZI|nr:Uu.00g068680.m01.CDS01 [Anthostomella pinea]
MGNPFEAHQDALSPEPKQTGAKTSLFHRSKSVSSQKSSSLGSSILGAITGRRRSGSNASKGGPSGPRELPPSYDFATGASPAGPSSGAFPASASHINNKTAHRFLSAKNASTEEDPYAFLSSFDTVFLIDDSSSMRGRSWKETQDALATIVPICTAHDEDGVDVFFLNHKSRDKGDAKKGTPGTGYRNVGSLSQVREMFQEIEPTGVTPTGTRLNYLMNTYVKLYENKLRETGDVMCLKPLNIIVITDGIPTDDVDLPLTKIAIRLDKVDAPLIQLGVQFFQVSNDPSATEALRRLDDELGNHIRGPEAMRDIVDTATFDDASGQRTLTADGILKVLLGSVVKRLDDVPTLRAPSRY